MDSGLLMPTAILAVWSNDNLCDKIKKGTYMKRSITNGIIVLLLGLLSPQNTTAQGSITYLSNLGLSTTGSSSVGSDSWLAADFFTGTNSSAYTLNSVQLAMTVGSGAPSGFTVMLYSEVGITGVFPGSSLGTLDGSLNPTDR